MKLLLKAKIHDIQDIEFIQTVSGLNPMPSPQMAAAESYWLQVSQRQRLKHGCSISGRNEVMKNFTGTLHIYCFALACKVYFPEQYSCLQSNQNYFLKLQLRIDQIFTKCRDCLHSSNVTEICKIFNAEDPSGSSRALTQIV